MTQLLEVVTLLSITLVIYHHIGYPLLLKLLQRYCAVNTDRPSVLSVEKQLPEITIVMPAYNEAEYIAAKLRNLAIQDYPADRYKVVVVCDGCTDATADIAYETLKEPLCQHLEVQIVIYAKNEGKIAVINKILPQLDTGLLVFSDVSALLSINALRVTANAFTDPKLGILTGHYQLLNPGSEGEQRYWQYQTAIKHAEASLGSTLGVHGAFYAFRSGLVRGLPENTINDDFVLPMKIVKRGYRAGYAESISAIELEQASYDTDKCRRRRIAAGNVQQLWLLRSLLHPKYKGVAFMFLSGKILRVFMPFFMLVSMIGSLFLASDSILFTFLMFGQLAGYLTALLVPEETHRVVKMLRYLVIGHYQSVVGTLRYLACLENGRW